MLLEKQKEKDFKVWLKSFILRVDELPTDINSQEQVDQREIENQEEHLKDIHMLDIWVLNK